MPTEDPETVLNLRRLEESAGGDRSLMLELISLYLADSDAKLPGLLAAADETELHRMGRVAHGLKGSSAAMGCEEAARAFRVVEEMGRAGETHGLDGAVRDAQAAWRRACERLRSLAA